MNNRPLLKSAHSGFSLLELTLYTLLAALLVLGLVQIVSAASAASRLQDNQAQLQENARLAINALTRSVLQTGFNPQPWNDSFDKLGLGDETLDSVSAASDRLALRGWSDLNCFDNRNPLVDEDGRSRFFVREYVYDLNSSKNLTRTCRYGPSLSDLTTQIRRQGFVPGVEAFQLLFGEDADRDGDIESWVRAGRWSDPALVLGVRIGLLLSSPDSVAEPVAKTYEILDFTTAKPADGRSRNAAQFSASLRGRSG